MTSPDSAELALRPGAVTWREVDGEAILLDLGSSEYLGVNASGTVLWQMLDAGTTERELVAALQERFGVPADAARTDVDAFLTAARERNLLA